MTTTVVEWTDRPRRALPRRVPAFQYEVVHTYLLRLAHANHLDPAELTRYLKHRNTNQIRMEWLAALAGIPEPTLTYRLTGTSTPAKQALRHARPACRWCMARRGIFDEAVWCCPPDHVTVCHRHRTWIGPPVQTVAQQRDISTHPEVIRASRRHHRLVALVGASAAGDGLREAAQVVEVWHRTGSHPIALTDTADHVDARIATYPHTIALALIFADPSWRAYAATAPDTGTAGRLTHHRKHDLYDHVSRQLNLDCHPQSWNDPLAQWVRDRERSAANLHRNAALTTEERRDACEHIDAGTPIKHVADQLGVSRRCLAKWYQRWCADGLAGLADRSSTPVTNRNQHSETTRNAVEQLRRQHHWGSARIAKHLRDELSIGIGTATVHRILTQRGISVHEM